MQNFHLLKADIYFLNLLYFLVSPKFYHRETLFIKSFRCSYVLGSILNSLPRAGVDGNGLF